MYDPSPHRTFDLLVIGGGIVGAGVARDAALRGLSCLLLEKGDFSSGSSSKSSRLVHGGLSYLASGDLQLAVEALHERDILVQMAPHLLRRLPALLPVYRGDRRRLWKVHAGLRLYEALTLGKDTQYQDILAASEVLRRAPFLRAEGLQGAGLFGAYQLPLPERLVLENVLSAREHGAVCLSYHEAVSLSDVPEGIAVEVRADAGETRSYLGRAVVNAAGAWADAVAAHYAEGLPRRVCAVKGTHLAVVGRASHAVFASWPLGARLFLCAPLGRQALVGLAPTAWSGEPDLVAPTPEEIEEVTSALRHFAPDWRPNSHGASWAHAGLHPLAAGKEGRPTRSRRHTLHREGRSRRFFTIAGGNYTNFRRAAEEVVDAVCGLLKRDIPSSTDRIPFFGGGLRDRDLFREDLCECTQAIPQLPREAVDHLVGLYGRRCCDVIEVGLERETWQSPIAPGYPDLGAQVVYAARRESVRHLDDVVLRRLRMGLSPDRGLAGAEAVSHLLAAELGWDQTTRRAEVERFEARVVTELSAVPRR